MDENLTDAEREFEEWWDSDPHRDISVSPKTIAWEAYARANERTARRCVEICNYYSDKRAIAKEFGLTKGEIDGQ